VTAVPTTNDEASENRSHFKKVFWIWLPIAVVVDVVFVIFAGPHLPPGAMTESAKGAQTDTTVITATALPVILAIWIYMAYALVTWRHKKDEPLTDGPPIRGNYKVQFAWIATTSVIVISMFVYGTIFLIVPNGAGGGEGPNPVWSPSSHNTLVVQVIAQQWKFTYRYPSFGGMETNQLVLPVGTEVAFHVTSLDVIHDFWAYQLGVKADANPGSDNVAFTKTNHTGTFRVQCDELCGIWHGAMFNYGTIVSATAFQKWATTTQVALARATALLPPFAWGYVPDANGADGGYYPDTVDPYSNSQVYPTATPTKR
jgi:cytochrome c oxidase subunit 2